MSSAEDRATVALAVARLREARDASGGRLPDGLLEQIAGALGVGRSTLQRHVTHGSPADRSGRPGGWSWVGEDRAAYFQAAGDVRRARRILREVDGGRRLPSESTMRRAARRDFAADERALARDGEAAGRAHRLVVGIEEPHRNAIWWADHSQLDLDTLAPRGSRVRRPWMTLVEDGYSRLVVGASLSLEPNRGHILAALGMGIRDCGTPQVLAFDRGRDFLSRAVREHAVALGYVTWPLAGYHPHHKGKVERLHRTLHRMIAHRLGTVDRPAATKDGRPLLGVSAFPLDVVVQCFYEAVVEYNDTRGHRSLAGRTPRSVYDGDPTPERRVPPQVLRRFLLGREHRRIAEYGVRFRGRHYWAPELEGHRGGQIEVRFAQDDLRTIEIYRHDEHWCTAVLVDPASVEQREQVLERRRVHERRARRDLRIARRNQRRTYKATVSARPVQESTVVTEDDYRRETAGTPSETLELLARMGLQTDLDA